MSESKESTLEQEEKRLNGVVPEGLNHKASGIILVHVDPKTGARSIAIGLQHNKADEHFEATMTVPSGKVAKMPSEEDEKTMSEEQLAAAKSLAQAEKRAPVLTASREAWEETLGCLGTQDEIRALIARPSTRVLKNNNWLRYEADPASVPKPFIVVTYAVRVDDRGDWIERYNNGENNTGDSSSKPEVSKWYWMPIDNLFDGVPREQAEYEKTEFFQKLFLNDQHLPLPPLPDGHPLKGTKCVIASYCARSLFLAYDDLMAI